MDSQITQGDVHWIVRILLDDVILMTQKERLFYALGLTAAVLTEINFRLLNQASGIDDFLRMAMSAWISGNSAVTVRKLVEILREENFLMTANKIEGVALERQQDEQQHYPPSDSASAYPPFILMKEIQANQGKLQFHIEFLKRFTVHFDQLTQRLVQDMVITSLCRETIMRQTTDRTLLLCSILADKLTNENYDKFLSALKLSGNCHIVEKLEEQWTLSDMQMQLQTVANKLSVEAADAQKSKVNLNKEIDETSIKLANMEEKLATVLDITNNLTLGATNAQIEKADLNNKLEETHAKLASAEGKLATLQTLANNITVSATDAQKSKDEFRKKLDETNVKLANIEQKLIAVQQKSIPIGFIYFQIAKEMSPEDIWPSFTWSDVSEKYKGLFFRVVGEGSAPLGDIQEGHAPRLSEVSASNNFTSALKAQGYPASTVVIPASGWSNMMWNGHFTNATAEHTEVIKFRLSEGEVRPKNTAMRIWRRIR